MKEFTIKDMAGWRGTWVPAMKPKQEKNGTVPSKTST